MRRREFITIFAGAAGVWPLDARAQQLAIPVIGFLSSASPNAYAGRVAAFREGLNESSYIDGQNVAVEFRWAQGIRSAAGIRGWPGPPKVAVIVSSGGDVAALSAKAATSSIPIVVVSGTDRESGTCRQLQPAGGQHHRRKLCRDRVGNKAPGNIARCG
jgi:putative tryptophan/tyrosine transport system substrate-binding protein